MVYTVKKNFEFEFNCTLFYQKDEVSWQLRILRSFITATKKRNHITIKT